jgi:ABC-type Fe3+-hydroxamate transport system substrate-binding protein
MTTGGERGETYYAESISEEQILDWDWDDWLRSERKKTNPKELTKENCINDWVILNSAWENTDE